MGAAVWPSYPMSSVVHMRMCVCIYMHTRLQLVLLTRAEKARVFPRPQQRIPCGHT